MLQYPLVASPRGLRLGPLLLVLVRLPCALAMFVLRVLVSLCIFGASATSGKKVLVEERKNGRKKKPPCLHTHKKVSLFDTNDKVNSV